MNYSFMVGGVEICTFTADSLDDYYIEDFIEENLDEIESFPGFPDVEAYFEDEYGNTYNHTYVSDCI